MQERLASERPSDGLSASAQDTAPRPEAILHLDLYRLQKEKHDILHRLAGAALNLCGEDTLSCKLIDFYEEGSGDYTLKFALYNKGFTGGKNSVSNHQGWSGGPESKRIVVVSYSHELGTSSATELHPRNFKYVESDVRSKRRQDETHDKRMEFLNSKLQADYNAYD